jgi:aspartate aminotransferase
MFERGLELKRRYGADSVADLSLGNPLAEPPPAVRERLRELVTLEGPGVHRYMPNAGFESTRRAVAAYLGKKTGLPYEPECVTMTVGAAGALNVFFRSVLRDGDEVIAFAPYFPDYPAYVANYRGTFRACPSNAELLPDLAEFERLVGPTTRAVIVNSPNNPTGVTYPEGVVQKLAEILKAKTGGQAYLVADEPYRDLVYEAGAVPWPAHFYDKVVHVTSFSKTLSLAGERIGYVALSPRDPTRSEVQGAIVVSQRVLGFVSAPALQQRLVEVLLDVAPDLSLYAENRNRLCDGLAKAGYRFTRPGGAFYAFPQIPPGYDGDAEFIDACLEERVLVVPGVAFGTPGFFRVCFSVPTAELDRGVEALSRVAAARR